MTERCIVVAEDEPRILRSILFIIEREGGRGVGVTNGQAALQAIRDERPVLAILDWMMPGLDGLEVTRAVRADPDCAATPILVVTAMGQRSHEDEALAAGATAYVRKPFDPRILRETIATYLGGGPDE